MTYQFGVLGPLPVLLVACFVFFSLATPNFLSSNNLSSMGQQSVFLLLMACAQMLILVSGGFDMSVSATVAFVSIASSTILFDQYGGNRANAGHAVVIGLLVALLTGLVIGLVNGLGVTLLKINAFIVTLAVATVVGDLLSSSAVAWRFPGFPRCTRTPSAAVTCWGSPGWSC